MGSKNLKELAVNMVCGDLASSSQSGSSEMHKVPVQSQERTLLLVGSKGVGKSTLISRYLEKTDPSQPTLALEYVYARKAGKNVTKDICHIWELGSGACRLEIASLFSSLPLKESSFTLILMLDLSKLNSLWLQAELFLTKLRAVLNNNENIRRYSANQEPLAQQHTDNDAIERFPVSLLIIGGKYDMFENIEPNKKRLVVQCVRYLAHRHGGSLLFHSSVDSALLKRTRQVVNHYAFDVPLSLSASFDYNRPVFVPFGADSFTSIEATTQALSGTKSMDKYRHLLNSQFPQENDNMENNESESVNTQNYIEPDIDTLKKQKLEDLEQFHTKRKFSN